MDQTNENLPDQQYSFPDENVAFVPERHSHKKLAFAVGVVCLALSLGLAVHHFRNHTFVRRIAQMTPLAPIFTPVPSASPSPLLIHDPSLDILEATPSADATLSAKLDKTYQNDEFGFSFQYPSAYKIMTDPSGWPQAVALLYAGGQSYDLSVEVATSAAEFQKSPAYGGPAVVKNMGQLYVILDNANKSPVIDSVIESFQFTDGPLNKKFVSADQKVSLTYYANWLNKNNEFQGPHQVLRLLGSNTPEHNFDDFTSSDTTIEVAGKSFPAKKWTSDSWRNSFIEVNIGDQDHPFYIQYGDAASVGFTGYEQKYDEKVDFDSDVKPVQEVLKTLQIQ